jgi:DNA-binding SARP family transcriptional activator
MGEVGFNQHSNHWLDVSAFEEQVSIVSRKPIEEMSSEDAVDVERALGLYVGELLEGFYHDWAIRERERLRSMRLKAMGRLMRYYSHHGVHESAIEYGQKILDHDPLKEEIHRALMGYYAQSGQRTLAIRQYKACCQILASELDVPPMEETVSLYTDIIGSAGKDGTGLSTSPPDSGTMHTKEPAGPTQGFRELHTAIRDLERAREHFRHAIQLLEKITNAHGLSETD